MNRTTIRAAQLALAVLTSMLFSCAEKAQHPIATPSPSLVSVHTLVNGGYVPAEGRTVHGHIAHGSLIADVTYPVTDYNNQGMDAARLRVSVNHKPIADKLVDQIPIGLRIATLEGGHEVVILDDFSGGAHCCFGVEIIDPTDRDFPFFATHDFGDAGYTLMRSSDGSGYVFKTADNSIAYQFSSFAGSTFPILILALRNGSFVDVTNSYPNLIERDAKQHWKEYLTDASSSAAPDSAVVAYLADSYRLGDASQAWQRVKSALGNRSDFYAAVSTWLVHNGYAPTPAPPAKLVATPGPSTCDSDAAQAGNSTCDTTEAHFDDPGAAQAHCPSDVVVWVNTRTGVFHFQGERWYGATEEGTYECERDAIAEGDRVTRNGQ